MKHLLLLISFLVFSSFSIADEKLDSMKSIYDREMSKIDDQYISDMSDIQKVYLVRIEEALKKAADKADLDSYEKIDQEKKRFHAEKTIPPKSSVQPLLDKAEQSKYAATLKLANKYVAGLKNHMSALLKAKDIQGAKAVQGEIKRVELESSDLAAQTKEPEGRQQTFRAWKSLLEYEPVQSVADHGRQYYAISTKNSIKSHTHLRKLGNTFKEKKWIWLHPFKSGQNASTTYVFDEPITRLSVDVKVQSVQVQADATFLIYNGERLVARHTMQGSDNKKNVSVELGRCNTLRLEVNDNGTFSHSWAFWIDPKVK